MGSQAGTPHASRSARRSRGGVSIVDVANLAGVSEQTVSRVSTGATNVRDATRRRVLDAMAQLGYSPNTAARALRSGSFGTIGLIAHQLARTGESRSVEAVVEAARAQQYNVSLVDLVSPSSPYVDEAVQRLTNQAIDGLVIIRAEKATPATLALPANLPVAVSDSKFIGHHPAVGSDQPGGIAAAVHHLLSLGHATVHHLAGPATSTPADVRLTAWRTALLGAGRRVPPALHGDWSAASGYALGKAIAADDQVTAVLSANDEMAFGLLRALHEHGRRVPQDVSVVGFDDIALAEYAWPPLTTVRQDYHQMGIELVGLLMRQLRDHEDLTGQHTLVPTTLVERASTAPPPSR